MTRQESIGSRISASGEDHGATGPKIKQRRGEERTRHDTTRQVQRKDRSLLQLTVTGPQHDPTRAGSRLQRSVIIPAEGLKALLRPPPSMVVLSRLTHLGSDGKGLFLFLFRSPSPSLSSVLCHTRPRWGMLPPTCLTRLQANGPASSELARKAGVWYSPHAL